MKTTTSKFKDNQKENIISKLRGLNLDEKARKSGFTKRKPKKIRMLEFLLGFIMSVFNGCSNSIEGWAKEISLLIGETVSKQGLWKKMVKTQIIFLRKVLEEIISQRLTQERSSQISDKLKYFRNIILEDSTKILLNEGLSKEYSGRPNGENNRQKGVMKIQTMYNVSKETFVRFDITKYSKNDQSMAWNIFKEAKAGDLIIRDLGYFILEAFKKFTKRGIYFVSRFKYNVNIYDKNEKSIDIVRLLRGKRIVDVNVIAGEEERVAVRLVAIRLDNKVSAERKRKARLSRDKRTNHSKKYIEMLGWEIFITNIDSSVLSAININEVYGIRWRIETIYKCWKSYFKFADIQDKASIIRVESYIHCMLIYITLFQIDYYKYYEIKMLEETGKEISIVKLSHFIRSHINLIILSQIDEYQNNPDFLDVMISYYCPYEKRKKRRNFYNKFKNLS